MGIESSIGDEIARYTYQYPGRPTVELVFLAVPDFLGEPRNLAFERIDWADRARLLEFDFLEGDGEFVQRLVSGGVPDRCNFF